MIKSLRIKTISELIDKSMVVADIGCDHAYLSILLKEKGLKSVAIDNKETVIGIALKNIKKHNDKDYVEVILSDGLEFLPNYVNTLVISGMGGKNIIDILKKGDLSNIDNLILLPHKDLFILRQSLQEIGFKIANEYLVLENRYYVILKCIKGISSISFEESILGVVKHPKEYYLNLLSLLKDKPKLKRQYELVHNELLTNNENPL